MPHTSENRATMLDVARLAGVSLKTVSRVVNRESGVSPALVDRVDEAVRRLGYRHNLAASNLRRGQRTASIGVLVQDLSNGYCADVLRAIEDRARAAGVVVLAASTDEDDERERELVDAFIARRTDGLVLMPSGRDLSYLASERAQGLALVMVDRPAAGIETDSVLVNNDEASTDAVADLLARGHRRIAMLGDDPGIFTARERLAGYHRAFREAGVTPDPDLVAMGLRTEQDAYDALAGMLAADAPPTAVFAARNVICLGAVHCLRDRDLNQSVALVGFDEVSVADFVDPKISIVSQDTRTLGERAVEILLSRLDGDTGPVRTDIVPTVMVRRGSGEIAPAHRVPQVQD